MNALKEFFSNSATKTVAFVTFLALVFIVITYNWLIEFSAFSVGMAKAALGVFLVWVFDKYAMPELSTVNELKKGNIAYALYMLGLFLLIAAAIVAA